MADYGDCRCALRVVGDQSSSYIEPIVRYDVSFAGDPTTKNISNLRFAPTFNLGLPDRWFITFYPNAYIRINLGDPITGQTGRLFLPFDARIGRNPAECYPLRTAIARFSRPSISFFGSVACGTYPRASAMAEDAWLVRMDLVKD